MNKNSQKRQHVYDSWHKEVYQLNLNDDIKNFSFLHDTVFKYLHITDNTKGKLLDIACGKGLFLKSVSEINSRLQLFGSDISRYAVEKAIKIVKRAKFTVDDAESISLDDNQFDYITCLGGVEYFNNPTAGIKEIKRLLTPQGTAIIFVPNLMFIGYIWLAFWNGSMPSHGGSSAEGKKIYDYSLEKFYTYQGWVDVIEKGKLRVVSSYRFDYIGGTKYASPAVLKLYNLFLHKFVPFYLAYSFVFICKK